MDAYSQYNSTYSARFALLPSILIAAWHMAFIVLGTESLITDTGMKDVACGHSTHLYKYALLNSLFALVGIGTYCFFPGGGEGARARALVMTIFHFAFLAWGVLMWIHLSPQCQGVINKNYGSMQIFLYACIGHNGVFGVLFFLHEVFSHKLLGFDMTLVAEVTVKRDVNYTPANPIAATMHSQPPTVPNVNPEQNDGALSKYLKEHPMPEPVAGSPQALNEVRPELP